MLTNSKLKLVSALTIVTTAIVGLQSYASATVAEDYADVAGELTSAFGVWVVAAVALAVAAVTIGLGVWGMPHLVRFGKRMFGAARG